jgi:serine-threonine kinase receptor-associated protein
MISSERVQNGSLPQGERQEPSSSFKLTKSPLVCHGHTRPIVDINYSQPTPDGIFLSSASKDGQPQLRNGTTGDWIGTFQGHKGAVWSCELNDSAFVAATGSADFTARVWDATSGDELCVYPHKHIVRTTAFERGATSTRLLTGGAEKVVRVYDLSRGSSRSAAVADETSVLAAQTPLLQFGPAPDRIRKGMWSMDNRLILLSYLDNPGVDVIDLASGQIVRQMGHSEGLNVVSMEYTACGRYLVTAERETSDTRKSGGFVKIRDADTFEVKKEIAMGDAYEVHAASYCPVKGRVVAGGSDMWVHVYDSSGAEIDCGRGHHGPVHCTRISPDGCSFATGSEDGTIRIWNW